MTNTVPRRKNNKQGTATATQPKPATPLTEETPPTPTPDPTPSPTGAFEGSVAGPTGAFEGSGNPAVAPPTPTGAFEGSVTGPVTAEVSMPLPPKLDAAAMAQGITAGWVNNRVISYLYSYDDPAGVWVWVVGVGWKRLSPASLFGHGHMAILATLATHDNITVDYHEDAAGRIDQILV